MQTELERWREIGEYQLAVSRTFVLFYGMMASEAGRVEAVASHTLFRSVDKGKVCRGVWLRR